MPPTTRRTNGYVRRPSVRHPIPKDKLVELSPKHNKECMFCGRKEISETLYGLLYQLNDVVVHYFCILLSSRAVQNGADREGIWGFLLEDIKSELDRGSRESCCYCNKNGATIACCGVKCRKKFHLPCGLQNGSMHQYFQSFKSFCFQHRITQTVDLKELQDSTPVQCAICKEDTIPTPVPTSIWAPCCKRNAWFHRKCIQELALSAGYFFKCPLCNNVDTFKSRMLTLGIYIPSRDASWETVPNAYVELLERHSTCNADKCLCPHPEQRNYQQETGSWEIILCHTCGSNGTHMLCSSLKCDERWYCTSCRYIAGPISMKRRRLEVSDGSTILDENRAISMMHQRQMNTRDVPSTGIRESITPSILDENRSLGILNQRRINTREIPQTGITRFIGSSILDENRSSNLMNLRRNNTRDIPLAGIRESTRLNNREARNNIPTPLRIIGSIVISDDESDEDIQIIDPPESQSSLPSAQTETLPIISNVKSIRPNNNMSWCSFRSISSSTNQTRDVGLEIICDSIDLTNSDDEGNA